MKIHSVEQNTPEWINLRLGIPTASEFSKIVTPGGKISTQACGYLNWLLAEWFLGTQLETAETQWMQRGHELESRAVESYEFETGAEAEKVGFVTTDNGLIGASPDRLVGTAGILEIKCPAPHTHVGYMLSSAVDKDYWPQLQGQLLITEREWVDIQSYCPGLPAVIIRVTRDEKYIGTLSTALREFVDRMVQARAELESRYGPPHRGDGKPKVGFDALGITDEDVEIIIGDGRFRRK